MDGRQRPVVAAVVVILAVTLLSGPLVGAVDLTTEPDSGITDDIGSGSANVTVESFPERATISEGRYGAEKFYLRVPPARVELSNVVGQPQVKYDIDIPELGFSSGTTTFVTAEEEGRRTFRISQTTFDAEEIDAERYNATLRLFVRADGTDRIIRQRDIVVEVER